MGIWKDTTMKRLVFALLLVVGVARAAVDDKSLKIEMPVEKFVLENGLTVLLHEDHTVPMVSYHTWYKVGSRDEKEGITGSAHMLEHMMFQGAKKYTGKQLQKLMDENGVEWNAFTTNDYTGFYMNLPSSKLELIMDVEYDRMSSLALDPKNLLSEREVVKEERRMRIDNSPFGMLREMTMSTVFRKSNYRWPVIGWMKDIEGYNVETLRRFYETFYVPNNAVLVIAGDFDTGKVKKMVQSYYGKLPSKPLPPREDVKEPEQKVQYNSVVRKDVQSTSFNVAFQGASVSDPDMYALDLAATALGTGSSSRLYRRLVYQKQTAASAYASHYSLQNGGVFSVGVTMRPGLDKTETLEAVYNEIYKLKSKPLSSEELRKVKVMTMKSYVDALTTLDGKARSLATAEITTGSYETIFRDLEKYEAVTAEDIRRVANKLMNQTQRSIVALEPKAKAAAPAPTAAPVATPASTPQAPEAAQ